ncbi:acyloxyacyl hydrolase [Ramlibacter tataouinensis]|uniref:Lipid A deacylase n=1 Tax=Ramlibacter tataouinensis (strain ATCC BAA-407 / DSM 14655 / LMG 21543 / TTB310) TaxID=365046 RepID=F5Y2D0_RAMTT|nr:acyloxyacyl hydrolase [Ramlibacter tataouinensis]AEG91104.1 Conserved hypothetical protein [Ramlibacter tataouinensis TTB310]
MKRMPWALAWGPLLLAAAWAATARPAAAQPLDLRPAGIMVQGGAGEEDAAIASVGLVWPWSLRRRLWGSELTGMTEAYGSLWRARDFDGGWQHYTQFNLVPMLRLRFAEGRSPWFAEAGIGVSLMDEVYRTPDKGFSTRFQFTDVVGAGRSFGADRRHELSLRLTHYSNAGIKKPNPGINYLQLRYGLWF